MSDEETKPSPFQVISGRTDSETETTPPHQEPDNDEGVLMRIRELEEEHRDLDQAITAIEERMPYDRLSLQRMKKRKLVLKDKIVSLRDKLHPDIIA